MRGYKGWVAPREIWSEELQEHVPSKDGIFVGALPRCNEETPMQWRRIWADIRRRPLGTNQSIARACALNKFGKFQNHTRLMK